jgi:hypothetical protein
MVSIHEGLQSILFVPTVVLLYNYKRFPCVRKYNLGTKPRY